ncbi:MAG: SUMF1/EgtB/PvdO family nonheme iron enzyme [Spirochaetales bacterium]|uniref:SUMF1/EgtB/PvdO family nonheme iron enzyme n=1 Tax=Candidatus Thalassospirochaeta sargassi TaxID=3119039 RepID=A0AAJ1MP33_9SPIO|nr:SUMF1/EgtB/PvdO family nonheme iron enzyme [Spirochaetales bacterium]
MSDNDEVKLKPFLGMKPGSYLIILYTVIIIAVLFALLILPGIIKPGTLYSFESVPDNAVVFVDGKYYGATPCEVFVPAGSHEIVMEKKHFTTSSDDVVTGRRIIGSLFSKRKETYSAELALLSPEGFLKDGFTEFAGWGMIDTYFDNYQPKPVLGPLFTQLQQAGYADTKSMSAFLYSVIPFVHNELLYSDFLDAVIVFEEVSGRGPVKRNEDITADFTELVFFQDAASFIENLPFWFYSILSDENRESKLSWYPAMQEEYGAFLRDYSNDYPSAQAAVSVNGSRFVMLSGGQFLMGADGSSFPYPAAVENFFIMDREVSNELYGLFLLENPEWQKANSDNLISQKLVNQDYLKDFDSSEGDKPVKFVSWYAAQAFCEWFEDKLPAYLSDYSVQLPDEHQWEWAALTESDDGGVFNNSSDDGPLSVDGRYPNNSGLYDLRGNLWEWCDNWYAPASPLITSRNPVYNEAFYGNYDGLERAVRGGSWANEDSITASTRGSQPPEWCTEFLGFRPILVREQIEGN